MDISERKVPKRIPRVVVSLKHPLVLVMPLSGPEPDPYWTDRACEPLTAVIGVVDCHVF